MMDETRIHGLQFWTGASGTIGDQSAPPELSTSETIQHIISKRVSEIRQMPPADRMSAIASFGPLASSIKPDDVFDSEEQMKAAIDQIDAEFDRVCENYAARDDVMGCDEDW